ncbi:hypothetical protein D3C84_1233690 [compost metagenome]
MHLLQWRRCNTGGFEVRRPAFEQGERLLETAPIRALIGLQTQVPFADHQRVVAARFEQLGN